MENPNISANTKRKSNKFNSFNDEDNIVESNNSGDRQYHISNYLFDRVFNQQDEKIKEVKIELSNLKNELKNELKNGFENKWKATDDSIKDINQKISKIYTKEEIDNSKFISYPPKWAWGLIAILACSLVGLCSRIISEKDGELMKLKGNIEEIRSQLSDIQYKYDNINPTKQDHVKKPNKK